MAGSIEKINNNTYRLQYMHKGTKYRETVKVDNVKKEYKNDKQLQLLLADFVTRVDKGTYSNTNYTLLEYSQLWLDNVARPSISPITIKRYIGILNNHILPYFGNVELNKIQPLLINDFYNKLKETDCKEKSGHSGKLSKASVVKISSLLSTIMQHAYEMGVINENPCKRVHLSFPPVEMDEKMHFYDINDYNKVINLLKNENIERRLCIELALKTGMRRSEIWRAKI